MSFGQNGRSIYQAHIPLINGKQLKESEMTSRIQTFDQLRSNFFNSDIGSQVAEVDENFDDEGHALRQWAINKSWSYCTIATY